MNSIYFTLLQTVAAFIVKATKIDTNGDKNISGKEIQEFLFANVVPILLSLGSLKIQINEFAKFVKGFGIDKLTQALQDIVQLQLLPDEMSAAEEKIDKIASALFGLVVAFDQAYDKFTDVFGGNELKIEITKTKPVSINSEQVEKRADGKLYIKTVQ